MNPNQQNTNSNTSVVCKVLATHTSRPLHSGNVNNNTKLFFVKWTKEWRVGFLSIFFPFGNIWIVLLLPTGSELQLWRHVTWQKEDLTLHEIRVHVNKLRGFLKQYFKLLSDSVFFLLFFFFFFTNEAIEIHYIQSTNRTHTLKSCYVSSVLHKMPLSGLHIKV